MPSLRVLLLVILAFFVTSAHAQNADPVLQEFESVAVFDDAASIAASPDGMFYVVDQGSSTIHKFDKSGQLLRKLGGPGASAGQFDEPAGIDPTNGLILVVADAGNGRIQRFSSEFLYLESLSVGNYEQGGVRAFPDQPRYRQGEDASLSGAGRPIAVKTTSDNRMFAIDAEEMVIVEWDQDRNVTQVIGEYNEGEGALLQPVALELGEEGFLYVLDKDYGAIRVYDAFGGYLREMGRGLVADATAIKRIHSLLIVVLSDSLLIFQERGLFEKRIQVGDGISMIDVLYNNGDLYVLTSGELFKYTGDATSILKLDDL